MGILNKVKIIKCDITNFLTVKKLINKIKPQKIYYLCGESSVTKSYIEGEGLGGCCSKDPKFIESQNKWYFF